MYVNCKKNHANLTKQGEIVNSFVDSGNNGLDGVSTSFNSHL